jgi:hypothetical protein
MLMRVIMRMVMRVFARAHLSRCSAVPQQEI